MTEAQQDAGLIARNKRRREFHRMTKYEQSARMAGWVREGDIIYGTKNHHGQVYVNWEQCCLCENIKVAPDKPPVLNRIGYVLMIPYDLTVFVWNYWKERSST